MKRAFHSGLDFSARAIAPIASMWPLALSARPTERIILSFGVSAPPIGHIESVGDGSHGRAHAREIRAKPIGAILADEGEAGEPPQLMAAHGSIERARRRLLVGVAVQNHRNARSQGDDGRGRQVIFDNGEIDAATLAGAGRRSRPFPDCRRSRRRESLRSRRRRTAGQPAGKRPGSSAHVCCEE